MGMDNYSGTGVLVHHMDAFKGLVNASNKGAIVASLATFAAENEIEIKSLAALKKWWEDACEDAVVSDGDGGYCCDETYEIHEVWDILCDLIDLDLGNSDFVAKPPKKDSQENR